MEGYLIISIVVGTIVFFMSIGITICIWICICCKACKPPKFEQVPVTGHPMGLSVIPVFNYRYFLRSEPTILKLREKYFSWSGDDCTVKVLILVLRLCTFFYSLHSLLQKDFSVLFHIQSVTYCICCILE